jgi:hypothetical protein
MQSTPREQLLQFGYIVQAHLFERMGVELGRWISVHGC